MYISSIKRNLRKIIRNNLKRIKLIRQLHPFESLPSAQSQIIALKFRLFHLERKLRFHRFGKYLTPVITLLYDVVSGISVSFSGNAPWGRKPYLLPGFILTSLLKTRRRMAITFVALVVTTAGMFYLFQPESVSASWFNGSWAHRKPVTINHTKVTADQTNFPVLVSIQADKELAQSAQDDGDDIMFTSADGTTKLSHEIESFDGSTGKLIAWVKVPAVSSTVDTVLYMYYGNQSAGSQQDKTNVWNGDTGTATDDYQGVWHLSESAGNTAPQMKDSTGSPADGTTTNIEAGDQVAGKIGGSLLLDGTDESINVGTTSKLDPGGGNLLTVEGWYKRSTTTGNITLATRYTTGVGGFNTSLGIVPCTANQFKVTKYAAADLCVGSPPEDTNWHHLVIVWNGTGQTAYIDGIPSTPITTNTANFVTSAASNFIIGGGGGNTRGNIDEVRMAKTSRSASWIATEYNNQSAPQSFITVGDRQQKDSPILYWRFDEGAGTTAGDASGNKNTGTIPGLTAPTFIQEAETVWNTATTPKTTSNFNVQAGDVLVAYSMIENQGSGGGDISVSGGSLTWTREEALDGSNANQVWITIWTAVVDTDKTMNVSFTCSGGDCLQYFGGNVLTFRGSSGIGATVIADNGSGSGAPEVNITTTQEDSAVVVANADWDAQDGSSRVWSSGAGAINETTYFRDASRYTAYGGYYNSVPVGTHTVGLSAPSNQRYAIVAVEVKGSNSAPTWKSESECLFDGKCLQFNGTNSYVKKDTDSGKQSWWNDSYANRKKITMTNANLLFSDDFESGGFTNWSGGVTGTVTADTAQARNSIYSAKVVQSGGSSSVNSAMTNNVRVVARGYFYATANPPGNDNALFGVYNNADATGYIGVVRSSTGALCVYRLYTGTSNCSSTTFPNNQWNKIELDITSSTTTAGSYTLYLNGVSILTASSVRTNTSLTGLDRIMLGDDTTTQTIWGDDIAVFSNPTGGDLTDFPALVKLSNPGADFYNKTKGKGDDIRFVDDTGTLLSHEIESWNDAGGDSYIWVKMPKYPAGNGSAKSDIYMYYNNPNAVDGQNIPDVWSNGYSAVYHLAEDPSGTAPQIKDSKLNSNTMTSTGSMVSGDLMAGKIDGSLNFNGTTQYLSATHDSNHAPTGDMTVSGWMNLDQLSSTKGSMQSPITKCYAVDCSSRSFTIYQYNVDDTLNMVWRNSGGTSFYSGTNYAISASTWYLVTAVKSGNSFVFYVNADTADTYADTPSGTMNNSTGPLQIATTTYKFDGKLDNWSVSNTARSADWILAEYQSQQDATNAYGTEESMEAESLMDPSTNDFSVSVWFKHNNTAPSATQTLISRSNNAVNGAGYKVYMNTSGNVCFGIDDDATSFPEDTACSTAVYLDTKWHHAEAVKNGTSSIMLYIDGLIVSTDSSTTADSSLSGTNANFYVGIDGDGTSNPWSGFLDEIRYFDYAQTADQIKAVYNAKGSVKGATATIGGNDKDANLSQGLVGYWKMDDGVGNLCPSGVNHSCDSSGNGNDGTWNGQVASTSGKFANAVAVDGADDYVAIGDPSNGSLDFGTGSFTYSQWVYPTSNIDTGDMSLFKGGAAAANAGYEFDLGTGPWTGKISDGTTRIDSTLASSGTLNAWSLITVVVDRTTNKVKGYLNGKLVDTDDIGSTFGSVSNTTSLSFGANNTNQYEFAGKIDETRIYNRALTGGEVTQLYDWAPNPIGWWKLDEGSGTNANDSSGNGYTGSFIGSPKWMSGKVGSALKFDVGGTNYIDVPHDVRFNFPGTNPYTFSFWMKGSQFNNVDWNRPLTKEAGNRAGWQILRMADQNIISHERRNASGTYLTAGNIDFNPNEWTYVTFTYDGTNLNSYKNGILVDNTVSSTAQGDSTSALIIGGGGGEPSWDGSMDDIRIYNYARTSKQIIQDMGANRSMVSAGGSNPSMIGHWKFDEGYGTTANNAGKCGSACNGTLNNSPVWKNDGKMGKALHFNGSTQSVTATVVDPGYSHTISTWVYPVTSVASKTLITATKLTTNASSQPTFGNCTGTALPLSQWTHIVAVSDGSGSCTLYQNGRKTAGNTTGVTFGTSVNIGASSFTGMIDDVKLYNYPLSAQEVLMDYKQNSGVVMGALSTNPDGRTASNSSARAYCPPGNNEGNCDGTAGKNPAPVGHWTFDERTGTSVNDISGSGNIATLGSGSNTPKWSAGKVGGGLDFDGTNDFTSISDSTSLDLSTSSTFSLWIYPRRIPGSGAYESFIEKSGAYFFELTDTDDFDCGYGYNTARTYGAGLVTNKWQHLTCVIDGATDTVKMYLNGVLINTATGYTYTSTNNANSLLFGKILGDAQYTNMIMDDVKIYNYPRTPAQVAWDYNRGRPVGWWKFDECTGTTAYDASGNGLNGTISIGGTGQTAVGDCNTNANTSWYNGRSGKINSALNLDGANDYMYVNDTAVLEPQTDMTVAFWIKLTQTASQAGRDFVLVDKGQDSAPWFSYFIYQNMTDNKINFIRNNSSSQEFYMNGNTALQPGVWYHVSVVVKGTRGYIYLNGQDDTLYTDTLTGTLYPSTGGLIIGSDGGGKWLNGLMDDVRLYNYALTPTQIRTLKNEDSAVRFGPKVGP